MRKFFGTRAFYRRVILLMLPIMIQNGITNFVNMLDNIMVGRIGTVPMTGVAIANQLLFVYILCIFGAVSGAGIFGAQFAGKKDNDGLRHTFRFKLLFCTGLAILSIFVFIFGGDKLIGLYLQGEGTPADAAMALHYGKQYLMIMLIGLIPHAIVQCYSSTLRETGQTVLPMAGGVVAVGVNLVLNYILIFGHFGAPAMGVAGAATATVISRFVELGIVVFWTEFHRQKNPFIIGAFRSMHIPGKLVLAITKKGMPLMLNEALWASGFATLSQCYSVRGLNVVAANNIGHTFFDVFSVAFMAVGAAIGIIIGQMLGAGETEEARTAATQLVTFSVLVGAAVGLLYAVCAKWIPLIYNTNDEVRILAMRLMQISAITMPIDACAHASYFTLRSGGQAFITFLFDSCFMWIISIPVAFVLSHYTSLGILWLYTLVQCLNIFKCILGIALIKKGIWIRNIVQ